MAEVSAKMVKELREATGAGMLDCKKALTEADGDLEQAIKVLREKGLAAAQNKAGRIASEGLAYSYISDDATSASLVEVNSETDFVGKNQEFRSFVMQVAKQAAHTDVTELEDFLAQKWELDQTITIKEALSQKVAIIGENLSIRRFVKYVKSENGHLISYIHGEGKIAVLIELASQNGGDAVVEAGKNLAMQIAALSPKFVTRTDMPETFVEEEKQILLTQIKNDPKNAEKPDNILTKMIEGKLSKVLKDFCLLEQEYVKDGDLSVAKYLEAVSKEVGSTISVVRFTRFEKGEGLEKKQENFAEEVAKAIK